MYLRVCLFEKRHDAFVCVCEEKVLCLCSQEVCTLTVTVEHFWCISEKQVRL